MAPVNTFDLTTRLIRSNDIKGRLCSSAMTRIARWPDSKIWLVVVKYDRASCHATNFEFPISHFQFEPIEDSIWLLAYGALIALNWQCGGGPAESQNTADATIGNSKLEMSRQGTLITHNSLPAPPNLETKVSGLRACSVCQLPVLAAVPAYFP
jgi:hypothetical protein